jgi:hypothetical protein
VTDDVGLHGFSKYTFVPSYWIFERDGIDGVMPAMYDGDHKQAGLRPAQKGQNAPTLGSNAPCAPCCSPPAFALSLGAAACKLPRRQRRRRQKQSRWCCPTSVSRANTHMLMQDDNSLDIADILIDWIGKHVTTVE